MSQCESMCTDKYGSTWRCQGPSGHSCPHYGGPISWIDEEADEQADEPDKPEAKPLCAKTGPNVGGRRLVCGLHDGHSGDCLDFSYDIYFKPLMPAFQTDERADKPSSAEMLDEAHKAVAESIVGKPEPDSDPILTKTGYSREWWRYHFAGLAMQNRIEHPGIGRDLVEAEMRNAIRHADELLAELEKVDDRPA